VVWRRGLITTKATGVGSHRDGEVQANTDGAEEICVGEHVLLAMGGGGEPRRGRVLSEAEEMGVEDGVGNVEETRV